MYEKLVTGIRENACHFGACGMCPKLHKVCIDRLALQAADAIEDLQKQLQKSEVDNINLTGWLAEEHAKQCPHYIRNVHDRGDDSLCDKWMCEVKSLQKWIPVTERLPEKHEWVLVKSKFVKMRTDFINNDGHWYTTPGVTHWMPLPEPPEEET